jgi:hypothetical protein
VSMEKARIVEIFTPAGTGSQFGEVGSGYRIGSRLILTARHVVANALGAGNHDPSDAPLTEILADLRADDSVPRCRVRLLTDYQRGKDDAAVLWSDENLDVALLGVLTEKWSGPSQAAPAWTHILGVEAVPCTAVGFPSLDTEPDGSRESRQIFGQITPLTGAKAHRWAISVQGSMGRVPRTIRVAWSSGPRPRRRSPSTTASSSGSPPIPTVLDGGTFPTVEGQLGRTPHR